MRWEPHDYQLRAVEWVEGRDRCCLFMGMGMGKSAIVLTAFARLRLRLEARRLLVVAPKRVAEGTWADEAAKWDHLRWLTTASATGSENRRLAALDAGADVTVIGRDSLEWLLKQQGYRKAWPWDMVAMDELTSFKTPSSLRSKCMWKISSMCERAVGLTGTPAPNGLQDLWGELAVVDLGASLGKSVTRFRSEYFNAITYRNVTIKLTPKPGAREAIMGRLADTCLTMEAKDYLEMPPMAEEDVWVSMGESAEAKYKAMERERVLEFAEECREAASAQAVAASAAALSNKLAQMANGFAYDERGIAHRLHEAKTEALCECWEQARSEGSGLLVFYQYREDANAAGQALARKGAKVHVYDSPAALEYWNSGKVDALLCHPASTAYGLNMQGGGCCIAWLGVGWNLELYQQANARLHRQGQTRPVAVRRIMARGTVDELQARALGGKAGTQAALLAGMRDLARSLGVSLA